jgi:hypothetical protein
MKLMAQALSDDTVIVLIRDGIDLPLATRRRTASQADIRDAS